VAATEPHEGAAMAALTREKRVVEQSSLDGFRSKKGGTGRRCEEGSPFIVGEGGERRRCAHDTHLYGAL
jgi:hypothetical protein